MTDEEKISHLEKRVKELEEIAEGYHRLFRVLGDFVRRVGGDKLMPDDARVRLQAAMEGTLVVPAPSASPPLPPPHVSEDPRLLLKAGDCAARAGRTIEAVELYDRVAQRYAEGGLYLKAVAVWKQLLKIEPEYVNAHEGLAELYRQINLTADAFLQYEELVRIYRARKETQDLVRVLREMRTLDPENTDLLRNHADVLQSLGMEQEALELLERLYEHGSRDQHFLIKLGEFLERLGHPGRAAAVYEEFVRVMERDGFGAQGTVSYFCDKIRRLKGA